MKIESEIAASRLPAQAEVRYQMEITFRVNITPFVARQNVNVYLLTQVGNMCSAGEPTLFLGEQPYWKVPVYCAFPDLNQREKIGELAVDVHNGAILLAESHPSSAEEFERHVENAHDQLASSSAGK